MREKRIGIYAFLIGFSFFVTRWLFDIATTDIASKPYSALAYILLPLLIVRHFIDSSEERRQKKC